MNRTKKLVLAAGLTLLGGTAAFGEYARGYFNNWADDRPLTGTTGQYKVFGTTEPEDNDYMPGNAWHCPTNWEPYASTRMRTPGTPEEVALGDHPYVRLGVSPSSGSDSPSKVELKYKAGTNRWETLTMNPEPPGDGWQTKYDGNAYYASFIPTNKFTVGMKVKYYFYLEYANSSLCAETSVGTTDQRGSIAYLGEGEGKAHPFQFTVVEPPPAELSVEVTKFHQSYPYSGKATVEYTVAGTLPADAVAQIVINTDNAGAIFVQSNIVAGANSNVIDFASSFDGALLLTNASFAVMIPAENRGGVQLWANGPCWAECNVGAATPEEYGYYFWWGDTVGYTNTGSGWVSVKDGTSISFSDSGTAASTYGKDNAALLSAGYIDSTGSLVAAHDAATAHLGAPWSMPTDAEFSALLSNCTTMWITTNGVNGRLITGKGAYADRSIFLPAAGYGYDSCFDELGSFGYYWSSTPISDIPDRAWSLNFDSGGIYSYFYDRCYGRAVRPVREFALCGADGIVTYDPPLCTIEVTRFHQSYPYSGKAMLEYTVAGTLPADAVAQIVINTDDASATFVQSNIVAGANTNEIDFASSFGGALLLTNASFVVTLTTEELGGGVQLWADDGIVTYDPPETQTTPVPVAKEWIDNYPALLANQSGDYEAAANATAANGRKVWACYVAGLNPSDPLDDFRITRFWMDGYMPMFEFNHTTDGSGNSILPYIKPLGKARLEDGWRHVPDGGDPAFRFFAAEVVPPGCESIVVELGGVQLWENGPYWAECNVGAATPEEYGYYFWWGDTVGYRRENGAWVATDGSTSGFLFNSANTPTSDKDDTTLLAEGWIDSTGNLVAAHDAATAHRGSPWRMPTDAEFSALINNCTTKWITTNGVSGRLVTGKGAYADKSIFLPATGYGDSSDLLNTSYGGWSSTPYDSNKAWRLFLSSVSFGSFGFGRSNGNRYEGRTVRPVRNPTD